MRQCVTRRQSKRLGDNDIIRGAVVCDHKGLLDADTGEGRAKVERTGVVGDRHTAHQLGDGDIGVQNPLDANRISVDEMDAATRNQISQLHSNGVVQSQAADVVDRNPVSSCRRTDR